MTAPFNLPPAFAIQCPQCEDQALDEQHPSCPDCGFGLQNEGRIVLLEHAPSEEDYSVDGAGAQEEVRHHHFWFTMRNHFIIDLLSKVQNGKRGDRFVEFGSSNGLVMSKLEEQGWSVLGNDMHLSGLCNALPIVAGPLICAPLEKVRFVDPVEAVGFFDVIEHLDDDYGALEHAVEQLKPGGYLAVTVPAFQELWSQFDLILGHKRRYSIEQLDELFKRLSLQTVTLRYAFFFSYPIVRLQRKLIKGDSLSLEQRRKYYRPPYPVINTLLESLCRIELMLVKIGFRPPFGTSVMGLARKEAAGE